MAVLAQGWWHSWHTAGTALLGCDNTTALPAHLGNEDTALDVITEAPNHSWPLAAVLVRNIQKYIPKDCSGLVWLPSGEAEQEVGPGLSPLPHNSLHPEKIQLRENESQRQFGCEGRAGSGHTDLGCRESEALEQPLPSARAATPGAHSEWPHPVWIQRREPFVLPKTGNSCSIQHWKQPDAAGEGKPRLSASPAHPWQLQDSGLTWSCSSCPVPEAPGVNPVLFPSWWLSCATKLARAGAQGAARALQGVCALCS